MDALNKHKANKAKATTAMVEAAGKLKLEQLRLKQSELVHHDKIKKDSLFKGLDLQAAQKNKQSDIQQTGMDIAHQREKADMQAAKEANQAAAQHLHEVSLENQRAKTARENDFLSPLGGKPTE